MKCPNCGAQHYRIDNTRRKRRHVDCITKDVTVLECTCMVCGFKFTDEIESDSTSSYDMYDEEFTV